MTREEAREIARDAWRNRGHGDFYKTPDAISDALYDALTPPAPVVDDAAVGRALEAWFASDGDSKWRVFPQSTIDVWRRLLAAYPPVEAVEKTPPEDPERELLLLVAGLAWEKIDMTAGEDKALFDTIRRVRDLNKRAAP